jgi:hypothetical protein
MATQASAMAPGERVLFDHIALVSLPGRDPMIRRPFHTESGGDAWMLISQVEHARLSGALAAAWSDAVAPLA